MAKEVLEQVLGLLNGLTGKEIGTVHSKTRPRKAKLSLIETTRRRQIQYRQDIRSGKALRSEIVRR
ncbi:hypothetical protein ES703_101277 [subsurface metagenome]